MSFSKKSLTSSSFVALPAIGEKGKTVTERELSRYLETSSNVKRKERKKERKKKMEVQSNGIGLLASSPFSYALDCVPLHTLPFVVIIRIAGFVIQNLFSNSPGPSRISPRD